MAMGPSFIGSDPAQWRGHQSRALRALAVVVIVATATTIEARHAENNLTATVQSIVKNALGKTVIQFGAALEIDSGDSLMDAAQTDAEQLSAKLPVPSV